jgi:hypothetical protein
MQGFFDRYLVAPSDSGEWWVLTMRGRAVDGPFPSYEAAEEKRLTTYDVER